MDYAYEDAEYANEDMSRVDTRNSKHQAKVNHNDFATSNKSHKFKDALKIDKKRKEKQERDEHRAMQGVLLR